MARPPKDYKNARFCEQTMNYSEITETLGSQYETEHERLSLPRG